MSILLHAIVAGGYLGLAAWAWRTALFAALEADRIGAPAGAPGSGRLANGERVAILALWILHAWLIRDAAYSAGVLRFGFALALSATMWLAVALFWFESFIFDLAAMRLAILPLAAVCALLPLVFPGSAELGRMAGADDVAGAPISPWLPAHLAVALAAYGFLTIAALHALVMAALDRWLRGSGAPFLSGDDAAEITTERAARRVRIERRLLGSLPPLLTMERILFRLIGTGFVLLSLTVVTGFVFSEALFGRPPSLDHKTGFTLFAWLIFAMLLIGRIARGWRGRVALTWTLTGFTMLFLAYAGSRFVLEVILHRV